MEIHDEAHSLSFLAESIYVDVVAPHLAQILSSGAEPSLLLGVGVALVFVLLSELSGGLV